MATVGAQKHEGVSERIKLPALIVWGEREPGVLPGVAKRLASEIRGSTVASVETCGHYVQEEKPQELAKVIRDFLG